MIPMFRVRMCIQVLEYLDEVLMSGMIGEGPKVVEFKRRLEERFGCKNLIPLNSGTSALTLALRLAGVEGGEVITTPFTMIATNASIKAAGATPVFADIEENSVNISIESIRSKLTAITKAIMVTHVGGIPCEMKNLYGGILPIISDAAHAVGTYYEGKHISHWADFTCFSFQSIKHLTTGDGGAIVIQNDELYRKAEKLKWFGMTREVPEGMTRLQHQMTADVDDWGYKFHMNDIAASIGLANLIRLDVAIEKHQYNANYFRTELRGIKGVTLVDLPNDCKSSWFSFPLFVENREDFMKMMENKGIETTPMWRRNDEYTIFKQYSNSILPNMTRLQDKIVFIPVGWWVTEGDAMYMVKAIKGGW